MNSYDKMQLQKQISDEHGINYHKNVPLDGFTVILDKSFISFSFKEINGIQTVIITYMYFTKKEELLSLLAYCVNIWSGYKAKMVYFREHKRKSNVVKLLKHLDFEVVDSKKTNWKYPWTSTNGFKEEDCIEAYTKCNG